MSDRTDPSRPDVDPAGASAARPVGHTDDETAGTAAATDASGAGYTADTAAGGAGIATVGDVTRLGFRVLLIRGIFALILGVLLFIAPAVSAAVVGTFIALAIGVWLAGIYGIVFGIAAIVSAFRVRSAGQDVAASGAARN